MSGTKTKDYDYLTVSASVRAREARMLSRDKMERMIDSPTFEEAAKMLIDCGYEDMSAMKADAIEKALSSRRSRIFEDVDKLVPEKELVGAFRLKYDYHNAKVLIKAEGTDVDGSYLLSDCGNIPAETFTKAYNSEDYRDLPETLAQAVTDARSALSRTENPQLADFILDRAYFEEMSCLGEKLYSPFLTQYIAVLADTANLSAAVRCARMHRDEEFFKKAAVPGGTFDPDRIAETVFSGDGLAQLLSGTFFDGMADEALSASTGGSLTKFELSLGKAVRRFVATTMFTGFGAEAVVAYLIETENEITIVRMILTGKLSGVDPKLLTERLGD